MTKRLQLKKETLAELGAEELAQMAGGIQRTAASCGIVACTYTLNLRCFVDAAALPETVRRP